MAQGNIAQYVSPVDKLQPSEEGADALAQAGRRIGASYRQIGDDTKQGAAQVGAQVSRYETESEISQGSAAWSAMFNNKTAQWNEVASQPDAAQDKSIQATFLNNNLEPDLQKFQDGFTTEKGQQWALERADSMRQHFYTTTSADMSNLAAVGRMQDIKSTVNLNAATVYREPSSLDTAFDHIDSTVNAILENNKDTLTPEQHAKFEVMRQDAKNELAKTAVQGYADMKDNPHGPAIAEGLLNGGTLDQYIPVSEQAQMHKYIEGATRMKQEDQSRAYEQSQRTQKIQEDAAANKILNTVYNPQTGELNIPPDINQKIFSDQSLSAKTKLDLIQSVKKMSQDSLKDDPSIYAANVARMDPNSASPLAQADLTAQMAQGKITPTSYNFFASQLGTSPDAVAQRTLVSSAMQQAQQNILGTVMPGQKPSAEQIKNQTAFTNWFMPAYSNALQDPSFKGMSDLQKAQILLSPDNPKSLLTAANMSPFMASPQARLAAGIQKYQPGQTTVAPPTGTAIRATDPSGNVTTVYKRDGKFYDASGKEVK